MILGSARYTPARAERRPPSGLDTCTDKAPAHSPRKRKVHLVVTIVLFGLLVLLFGFIIFGVAKTL
jgi:hypothetical protein